MTSTFGAHHALLEMSMRTQRSRVGAGQADDRFSGREHERAWQAALRSQRSLTGAAEREANAALTSAVNQVLALDADAPWFKDPELHRRAIEEILVWATTATAEISSAPAQQAWGQYWALRSVPYPFGLRRRAFRRRPIELTAQERWVILEGARSRRAGRRTFLAAWQDWASQVDITNGE